MLHFLFDYLFYLSLLFKIGINNNEHYLNNKVFDNTFICNKVACIIYKLNSYILIHLF